MRGVFTFLLCLVFGCLLQDLRGQQICDWSGFRGCECSIMGACLRSGRPKPGLDNRLTGLSPTGLDQFRYRNSVNPNLAYICERDTVAIVYDCNARVPLYAAYMMTGAQLEETYYRPQKQFRESADPRLAEDFQPLNNDYYLALKRNICFRKRGQGLFVDADWYRAIRNRPIRSQRPCQPPFKLRAAVNRGHLIAAQYARGNEARIRATYSYTNSVPQFGTFNSGQWSARETRLIQWGRNFCNNHNGMRTQNVQMHIIVGTVPSTFHQLKPRFFGNAGFSDFQNGDYRVNVPRWMWTAACCTFEYRDRANKLKYGARSTAFFRENEPGKDPCRTPGSLRDLFSSMGFNHLANIDLFPGGHSKCYDNRNFVSVW